MASKIVLFLLFLTLCMIVDCHRGWGRHKRHRRRECPSRDDEDHVCCEWKTKTYDYTWEECEYCDGSSSDTSETCYTWHGRRRGYLQGCVHQYVKTISQVYCEAKCCEGWKPDEYGFCSQKDDGSTTSVSCENGGSPNGDNCICLIGFSGKRCETPVCKPSCLNNGVCTGENGKAVCVCQDRKYTGVSCETPVCRPTCQNNGSCIAGAYESRCTCPQGYEGKSCEKEVKDGDCPAASGAGSCAEMCRLDAECPNTQKCCVNGCGAHQCMPPANTTCRHQGEEYPVGHLIQKDICSTCVCKDPNSPQQWECDSTRCPRLRCPRLMTIPGMCCQVCDNTPTTTTTTPRPTTMTLMTTKPRDSCIHNGMTYPLGAILEKKEGCERCTCNEGRTGYPEWDCLVIDCVMDSKCIAPRYIDGRCCPVCDDKTEQCGLLCEMYCKNGFVIDDRGCPICKCQTNKTEQCGPLCKMYCKNGFEIDDRGCPICKCQTITPNPTPRLTTMTPVPSACEYNGEMYPHMSERKETECRTCTCQFQYGGHLDWSCQEQSCQEPACADPVRKSGQCCPVCPDPPPPPTFKPKPMCTHEGKQYPIGYSLAQKCNNCFCATGKSGVDYAEWICRHVDCPRLNCEEKITVPGQCCPDCAVTPNPTPRPTTMTPVPSTCEYNGEMYRHMSERKETECRTCTCRFQYGGHLDWSCQEQSCQEPACADPVRKSGQCCPVCPVRTTMTPDPPSTKGPLFRNCPASKTIIHTEQEKFVTIKESMKLTAHDSVGNTYSVSYSKTIIEAVPCACSRNIHIITAQSEPDSYGRFATCVFTVHVVDNHPPLYKTCPSSIAAFEDEVIQWDKPESVDNVGIRSDRLISNYINNTKFAEGSHVLIYIAVDHEGNIGSCRFLVAVYKRGTTDPSAPNSLKKEDEDERHDKMILPVVGVLAGLLLITAIVLLLLCKRYCNRRNNMPPTDGERHAYDNNIYAVPSTPPPSYISTEKLKLPPTYIEGDKKLPVYEEVEVKHTNKEGVNNPVYESDDELKIGQIKLKLAEEANA